MLLFTTELESSSSDTSIISLIFSSKSTNRDASKLTSRPLTADFQPNGAAPFAPSALCIPGQTHTYEGPKDFSMPKAMTKEDMDTVKQEFVQAAHNALEAGVFPSAVLADPHSTHATLANNACSPALHATL